MAGEFDQLLPCKILREGEPDLEFPVTSVKFSFQQDLVEHKYVGIDGASIERTGRGPLHFEVTIPLFNGIVPGKNERWSILYPNAFRDLLRFAAAGKPFAFQHPELDQIPCRVQSFSTQHTAEHRDGVELVMSFLEFIPEFSDGEVPVGDALVNASLAATDLDASKDDIKHLIPAAATIPFTLKSLVDKFTGFFDQIALQSKLQFGQVDRFLYEMNTLGDSVSVAGSALAWPITAAIERGKSAGYAVKAQPPTGGRRVRIYIVRAATTLAALAVTLGAAIGDLMKLNPALASAPGVPVNTVVRYFAT